MIKNIILYTIRGIVYKGECFMFSNKNFRSLFFSQAFSLFGSSLSTIAITQLFFNLSENNVSQNLGIVLVLKMCVYIIGAPLAHHFLKLFQQRKLKSRH